MKSSLVQLFPTWLHSLVDLAGKGGQNKTDATERERERAHSITGYPIMPISHGMLSTSSTFSKSTHGIKSTLVSTLAVSTQKHHSCSQTKRIKLLGRRWLRKEKAEEHYVAADVAEARKGVSSMEQARYQSLNQAASVKKQADKANAAEQQAKRQATMVE